MSKPSKKICLTCKKVIPFTKWEKDNLKILHWTRFYSECDKCSKYTDYAESKHP